MNSVDTNEKHCKTHQKNRNKWEIIELKKPNDQNLKKKLDRFNNRVKM